MFDCFTIVKTNSQLFWTNKRKKQFSNSNIMNNFCFQSKFFISFNVLCFFLLHHERSSSNLFFIQINDIKFKFQNVFWNIKFAKFFFNSFQHHSFHRFFNHFNFIFNELYRFVIFFFKRRFVVFCNSICQRCKFFVNFFRSFRSKKIKKQFEIERLKSIEIIRLTTWLMKSNNENFEIEYDSNLSQKNFIFEFFRNVMSINATIIFINRNSKRFNRDFERKQKQRVRSILRTHFHNQLNFDWKRNNVIRWFIWKLYWFEIWNIFSKFWQNVQFSKMNNLIVVFEKIHRRKMKLRRVEKNYIESNDTIF